MIIMTILIYNCHLNVNTYHVYHTDLPVYMVLTRSTAEIQGLLVNRVHFNLSLSGWHGGEPGNMHPCSSNA